MRLIVVSVVVVAPRCRTMRVARFSVRRQSCKQTCLSSSIFGGLRALGELWCLCRLKCTTSYSIFDFVRYFRHCVVSGPNSLYVFYYLRFPCRTSTRRGVWISVQFRLQRFRVYGYFSTVYLVSRAACGAVHANVETKSSLSEFVSDLGRNLKYSERESAINNKSAWGSR